MAYGRLMPGVRAAGLERTARFAGEAFGHEELAGAAGWRASLAARSGLLAMVALAAVALAIGLAALALN